MLTLLQQAKQLKLIPNLKSVHVLHGSFQSIMKGSGIDYKESRRYQHGDDIRFLDWKLSARTKNPYIKTFEEEKQMLVWLLIDTSPSMWYGSEQTKIAAVQQACTLLALVAFQQGCRVGIITFGGNNIKVIPPQKQQQKFISNLTNITQPKANSLNAQPNPDIAKQYQQIERIIGKKNIIFCCTDGQYQLPKGILKKVSLQHAFYMLSVSDPMETAFVTVAHQWQLQDIESQQNYFFRLKNSKQQQAWRQQIEQNMQQWHQQLAAEQTHWSPLVAGKDIFQQVKKLLAQH